MNVDIGAYLVFTLCMATCNLYRKLTRRQCTHQMMNKLMCNPRYIRVGPIYEDISPTPTEKNELKSSQAHGPVSKPIAKGEIELKTNLAYGPVPKLKEEIELTTNRAYGLVPKQNLKEEIELTTNRV